MQEAAASVKLSPVCVFQVYTFWLDPPTTSRVDVLARLLNTTEQGGGGGGRGGGGDGGGVATGEAVVRAAVGRGTVGCG